MRFKQGDQWMLRNECGKIRLMDLLLLAAICLIGIGVTGHLYENEPDDGVLHRTFWKTRSMAQAVRAKISGEPRTVARKTTDHSQLLPQLLPQLPPQERRPEIVPPAATTSPVEADADSGEMPLSEPQVEAVVADRIVPPSPDSGASAAVVLPSDRAIDACVDLSKAPVRKKASPVINDREMMPEVVFADSDPDILYSWVDENGVRTFGNRIPPEGATDIRQLTWDMKGDSEPSAPGNDH